MATRAEEEARLRELAKEFPVTKLPYMGDTFSDDLPEERPKQTRKTPRPKQTKRERLDDERRQRVAGIMARYT